TWRAEGLLVVASGEAEAVITREPWLAATGYVVAIEIGGIARLGRAWVDRGISVVAIADRRGARAIAIGVEVAVRVGTNGGAGLGQAGDGVDFSFVRV